MSLNVWFQEDITNILRAAANGMQVTADAAPRTKAARAWQAGYMAALDTIAEACGVRRVSEQRGAVVIEQDIQN